MKKLPLFILLIVVAISCTRIEALKWGEKSEKTLYRSGSHAAFPDAVQLKTGESMVVFREGAMHVSPDGNILVLRSDDGRTWSKPDTVASTIWDCRDPSIVQLKDGSILVNFFQSRYDESGQLIGAVGCFVSRSFDNGISFTAPRMAVIDEYEWTATSDAILELNSGRLLMPVYGGKSDEKSAAFVACSEDLGETWTEISVIAADTAGFIDFQEPALLLLPDGRILCQMRTAGAGGFIYQSLSSDNGRTWTKAARTNINGQAPDLFMTEDGIVLSAYRDFWPRGVSMMRSYDFGNTWEAEYQLGSATDDCAYPSIIALKDRLLAVYYKVNGAKQGTGSEIRGTYFNVRQPDAPEGFSASADGDGSARLRWNRVKGAAYYLVYRDTTEAFSVLTGYPYGGNAIASPTETSYIDSPPGGRDNWIYRITAVQGTGPLTEGAGSESLPTEAVKVITGEKKETE